MEIIENIDWFILFFINGGHTSFWDIFFIFITNKYTWIPLYILIAFLFIKKLGFKNGLILIGAAILCFAFTDLISSKLIKPWAGRPRPCHTALGNNLWLPNNCGGMYGFVSSHAANTMGIAVFCILVFIRKIKGKIATPMGLLLISYAVLNGLSRIYLGVHFPTDIICGALLGAIAGYVVYTIIHKVISRQALKS